MKGPTPLRSRLAVASWVIATGLVIGSGTDVSGMSTVRFEEPASASPTSTTAQTQVAAPFEVVSLPTPTTIAPTTSPTLTSLADAYLATRPGTADLAVYDLDSDSLWTTDNPETTYEAASVVKVTILIELLKKAETENRGLTTAEQTLARKMITVSDNDSTTTLWDQLGKAEGLRSILSQIGTTNTAPANNKEWGLTKTTASDQVRIMRVIAEHNNLLSDESRATAQALLSSVTSSQHWGVSAGVANPSTVLLKDGWLQSDDDSWEVNSVGIVDSGGHHYVIAALSKNNKSQGVGIETVEGLSITTWNAS